MNRAELLAKVAAGNAHVAGRVGVVCAVYRPNGVSAPIVSANLIESLPVYLEPAEKLQERPEWIGTFDFGSTLRGDYVVAVDGTTYFIGAQTGLAPVVCVQTNAILGMMRPAAVSNFGADGYSGVIDSLMESLISDWPASLVASGRAKDGEAIDNMGLAAWEIMLPALPVIPLVADLVTDDLGRIFVVTAAERTSLGWLLHVKQASS
jgi:hypothetical protein